jgi:DNA-binding transcriptional ArsR family regulator
MSAADRKEPPHSLAATRGRGDPAPVFAALGDPTRLELVTRLSDGQARSITQLTDGLGQTRQGVTKHLRVLEQAGLVSSIRIGRESQFAFRPEPIGQARSFLDAVAMQWDDALGRLQRFVEAEQRPPRRRKR